jgi:hypothetical protein
MILSRILRRNRSMIWEVKRLLIRMTNLLGLEEKVDSEVLVDLVGLKILSRLCLVVQEVAVQVLELEVSNLTLVEIKEALEMLSGKVEEVVEENNNKDIKMRISKDRENLSLKKSIWLLVRTI